MPNRRPTTLLTLTAAALTGAVRAVVAWLLSRTTE